MKAFEAIPVLNRLLAVLCRSLPAYLADAEPWAQADRRPIRAALDRLVADQQMLRPARRRGDRYSAAGGPIPAPFPPSSPPRTI